ncbi:MULTISPECIES: RcnB family protein [unclassified Sphingomonas]|uniref:RcnB family protein n=1 Tax=unclassified Sphingomonas TaxID=196159 RepID=UPI0021517CCE|nr:MULTISPECIES: RcnB family protein [unclassified Sphingomonas]MCR5872050.1 RcnB family protein [Sphingomonas sp. J344]UUX99674.1 RcnB family protein [Sphingomonas sp. J315]
MKKFVLAAVAASVAVSPILAAAPAAAAPQRHTTVVKHKPNGKVVVRQQTVGKATPQRYRKWQRGQRFDHRYAQNYRQIDYRQYNRQYRGHLNAPPRGYRYVQSGNDIVLVSIASGIIGAIFGNMIR